MDMTCLSIKCASERHQLQATTRHLSYSLHTCPVSFWRLMIALYLLPGSIVAMQLHTQLAVAHVLLLTC